MINLNALKPKMVILVEGKPCLVVSTSHIHMGRGGAILRIKLKNLLNNNTVEKTFKGNEKLEEANLQKKEVSFLYKDKDNSYFMDNEIYEQFFVPNSQIGEKIEFLKEGLEVEVLNFNGEIVSIELPPKIELKVTSAPSGVRGDTAQGNATKEVILETGAKVQVPLFIKEGEVIRINTDTGKYTERV